MKAKLRKIIAVLLIGTIPFTFQSCENMDEIIDILLSIINQTGWLQEDENLDNIPDDITPFDDETGGLASKVDLEHIFPPIGNQGSYGTCVTWSVGYNLKTALNAIENGWSSGALSDKENQTSPKDLWMAIPSGKKGVNCEGTNFEPALDALIADGAASMSAAPYSNLGNCNDQKVGDANNKLTNYRKIASETEGLTTDNFKGYLSAGRPVAIGAKLGDRFMDWNSSAVISSDTYNNPGMQHAYHAMVLSGYDDSKNAFRVRNSWGTSWGDNGSIWVDYDFFCRSFCFAAFVAQNENSITIGSGGINTGDLASGYDLLAYYAEDRPSDDPDFGRQFTYDVYNSGDQILLPSQKWSVVYMYYNATDANDYEVIFEDYYTDEFGEGDGYYDAAALVGGWWNNARVEPGKKAGEAEYPGGFIISYNMPKITGKYYLVVMADAYDVVAEANEDNNFYFITAENGKPLEFKDGVIQNMAKSQAYLKSKRPDSGPIDTETQTVVRPGNLNAYTSTELKIMLVNEKRSGRLDAKMSAFRAKGGNKEIKRAAGEQNMND